ncbi:MAG TPA: Rid family detoxifying hydrolase [Blastocatellia bacterium]|jgi:2-iminobutanoate/2-iminopropanoate deaminase|nr:Rid family detoxifying hydrolase [Blastocatellia bacterium]
MEIRPVLTPNAPRPAGHYSQAVVYNGIVYVSGQVPIDPLTGEKQLGSIEAQTEQTLKNVGEILKACDSDLGRVLKMTIYISDIALWGAVNSVYAKVMGEHRPARAVVPVNDLHYGFQIEIEAVAATRASQSGGA